MKVDSIFSEGSNKVIYYECCGGQPPQVCILLQFEIQNLL